MVVCNGETPEDHLQTEVVVDDGEITGQVAATNGKTTEIAAVNLETIATVSAFTILPSDQVAVVNKEPIVAAVNVNTTEVVAANE